MYALEFEDRYGDDRPSGQVPTVGFNPFGFCDPRIWPRKDNSLYQEYLEKVSRFLEWVLQEGYQLRLFTTDISVDRYAIEDLKASLLRRFSTEVIGQIFGSASLGVREVLREMSEFDFIVTSKFHGIIFSHLLGKPVIALSYHKKMDVAMRGLGQDRFCADVETFDVDWLIRAFRSLVADSGCIKLKSQAMVEAYAATLAEQFDGLFPNDIKFGSKGFSYRDAGAQTSGAIAT